MKFSGNVLNGTRKKWLDFQAARCVCEQDNSKTYGQILMKFSDMSQKAKGRNDEILGVIPITI